MIIDDLDNPKVGLDEVQKIYLGTDIVWERTVEDTELVKTVVYDNNNIDEEFV